MSAVAPELLGQQVRGVAYDSRKAGPGYLFAAFPGAKVDGRSFARQAVEKGAVAVLSELGAVEGLEHLWIQVAHGRRALATVAGRFYGHPDRRVGITGITGTNGKTTTSYLVDAILRASGKTTSLVGTIEYRLAGRVLPAVNTTPESLDVFELLVQLENEGGTHATMEVSSHALALGRAYGIHFHTAVFTNLTRDHLDFHGTMEQYFAAKQLLFGSDNGAQAPRYAVLNRDDEYGRRIATAADTEVITYGIQAGADARAARISSGFDGLRFDVDFRGRQHSVECRLVGTINVYNALAAWCVGVSFGFEPEEIAAGIASLDAVPGRFERVRCGQPFLVVVDYAHTDDALRNTIATARTLTERRVITVFGCGGDRDRTKRPLMGSAAAEASDFVVLTSDNPRSEDPLVIINDALVGIRRHDTPHVIEPDRERAIRRAIEYAGAGDVVIIAGKGHETYQVLGDRTISFDDRQVARSVLRGFGYEE